MGSQQLIIFKVMPEEPGQEVAIQEAFNKMTSAKFAESKLEPIAFGLNAIRVGFTCDAVDGIADKIETELKAIPNVSDVTLEVISLV